MGRDAGVAACALCAVIIQAPALTLAEQRGAEVEDSSGTGPTPPASLVHAEQGGDSSRIKAEVVLRAHAHNVTFGLQTATPRDGQGNLFDTESGLYDGAAFTLRYTYYSFYGHAREDLAAGAALLCRCWKRGLDVGEAPSEADALGCRKADHGWSYRDPAADAASCTETNLGQELKPFSGDLLLFIGGSAGGASIGFLDPNDELEAKTSTEASWSVEIGAAYVPRATRLWGVSFSAAREARAPNSKPEVCRELDAEPTVLRCDPAYLSGLETRTRLILTPEFRWRVGPYFGLRPAVPIVLKDGEQELPYLDVELSLFFSFGDTSPVRLGLRPNLRVPLTDENEAWAPSLSVFLGGVFKVVSL